MNFWSFTQNNKTYDTIITCSTDYFTVASHLPLNLLGHSALRHFSTLQSSPLQPRPPNIGGGASQRRRDVFSPSPHVIEQSVLVSML